jgi:hypothetical protein
MLFGDRDGNAGDPTMTLVNPEAIRSSLDAFELELWNDREEDGTTALGEPHHFHRIDLVARRVDEVPSAGRGPGLRDAIEANDEAVLA